MLIVIIESQNCCSGKGPLEMPRLTSLFLLPCLGKKHLCFVSVVKQCQKACWGCWVSSVLCHALLVTMSWPLPAGRISVSDWAAAMESVLQLKLPWRTLKSRLVKTDPDGNVDYMSCFYYMDTARPMHQVRRKTHPSKSWRNSFHCSLMQWFGHSSRNLHLN